jgi:NAD(P)-dependent dehydrogenase (short-subunit alcohol dehydrogenase family)
MAPQSTIIITGGTGSLGSSLARALETSYPGRFHLLLTCRNPDDEHAKTISTFLESKKGSFALEKLDLSDLDGVRTFVGDVKARVASGELKGLVGGGLVNSAANQTFFKGQKWKDVMYTVNCLAPALLMRGLLGVMLEGEGGKGESEGKEGEKVGFLEGMKRYGSCKLVTMMVGFAFQRRLYTVGFLLFCSQMGTLEMEGARTDANRFILRTRSISSIWILAR